jgi:hypothetical protein
VAASTEAFDSAIQQENDNMWLNPNARTAADAGSALAVSTHTHLCKHSSCSCRMPTSVSHSSARVLCDRLLYNNVAQSQLSFVLCVRRTCLNTSCASKLHVVRHRKHTYVLYVRCVCMTSALLCTVMMCCDDIVECA